MRALVFLCQFLAAHAKLLSHADPGKVSNDEIYRFAELNWLRATDRAREREIPHTKNNEFAFAPHARARQLA